MKTRNHTTQEENMCRFIYKTKAGDFWEKDGGVKQGGNLPPKTRKTWKYSQYN